MNKSILTLLFVCLLSHSCLAAIANLKPVLTCSQTNVIQVSGSGSVSSSPDVSYINIKLVGRGRTSKAAVASLARNVNKLILDLSNNGYSKSNYETISLYVYEEYQNGQVIGQIATQMLKFSVDLEGNNEKVGSIVDLIVSSVEGIIIESIDFSIKDKSKLQEEARTKAFEDGQQKARDYAELAGKKLGEALIIDDQVRVEAAPQFAKLASSASFSDESTQISGGELDINYDLTLSFELK